jgi:hypothetical protein
MIYSPVASGSPGGGPASRSEPSYRRYLGSENPTGRRPGAAQQGE